MPPWSASFRNPYQGSFRGEIAMSDGIEIAQSLSIRDAGFDEYWLQDIARAWVNLEYASSARGLFLTAPELV